MLTAQDLMTRDPATVPASATVHRATCLLQSLDVRHLPVVDDDGTLVGMLSDRDVRALAFPQFFGAEYVGQARRALDAAVSSLMSSDVISVGLETSALEIVDLMLEHGIGAVPVVDADGALVGIVSYVDLLREIRPDDDDAVGASANDGLRLGNSLSR